MVLGIVFAILSLLIVALGVPVGWATGPFVAIPIALGIAAAFVGWQILKQRTLRSQALAEESTSGLSRSWQDADRGLDPGRDTRQPSNVQLGSSPARTVIHPDGAPALAQADRHRPAHQGGVAE